VSIEDISDRAIISRIVKWMAPCLTQLKGLSRPCFPKPSAPASGRAINPEVGSPGDAVRHDNPGKWLVHCK